MKILKNLAAVILILMAASCSVKEDRIDCPCFLTLDFSEVPDAMKSSGVWVNIVHEDGTCLLQESISKEMYKFPEQYIAEVRKGNVSVSAAYGKIRSRVSSDNRILTLESGQEADSLFAHTRYVDCRGESAIDSVRLHKQWCNMTIRLQGTEFWTSYAFEVDSGWNGINLSDLSAVSGNFECIPRRTSADSYEIRLPRQGDNDMSLLVLDDHGDGTRGDVIYEYPIGQMINSSGYNWYNLDLDDLIITIDYARSEVTVEICPWSSGIDFGDITI